MAEQFPSKSSLIQLAESKHEDFMLAKPFPSIYLDNILPEETLNKVLDEFPPRESEAWDRTWKNEMEIKSGSGREDLWGPTTRELIGLLNSQTFITFLEKLSGIDNLIPDSSYGGGGLHATYRGGHLKVHADFNLQKKTGLHRRVNVILFLNKDWKEEWGGHLEFFDKEMKNAEVCISPLFNRLVIFNTSSTAYHGHPDALNCPEDRSRLSIALYYYTSNEDQSTIEKHNTIWKMREGIDPPLASTAQTSKADSLFKRILRKISATRH